MAIKPTIYKAQVNLADSDRAVYEELSLVLAQHPSETLERLAARLLAFCLNSQRGLQFTRGLSTPDEPDVWQMSDAGEVEHWIEIGQPEEPRLRKACGKAHRVSIYSFGRSASTWWKLQAADIGKLTDVAVWNFPWSDVEAVAAMLERTCTLNLSVVGGVIYIDNGGDSVAVGLESWLDNQSR